MDMEVIKAIKISVKKERIMMKCEVCSTKLNNKNTGNIQDVFPELFTPSEIEKRNNIVSKVCVSCKKSAFQAFFISVI
jgi:uncharacterized protein with PIN domain